MDFNALSIFYVFRPSSILGRIETIVSGGTALLGINFRPTSILGRIETNNTRISEFNRCTLDPHPF